MNDLLSKPYTLADFTPLLRRWLEGEAAAAPADHPAAAQVEPLVEVDRAAVAGLQSLPSGGGDDFYSRLVTLFSTSSAVAMDQLGTALQDDNLPAAGAIAHKLKASAANVGALAFSRHVRQFEQLCEAGDVRGVQRLYARLAAADPRPGQ